MSKLLWKPSDDTFEKANMTRFIDFVNERNGKEFNDYFELYDWSVKEIPDFWAAMWDFLEIKASRPYETVVDDLGKFPGAS